MSTDVTIAGVGMHPFGRFENRSLKDLARRAIVGALDDAGLEVGGIDAVYSANAMAGVLQGQEQIRGQAVLREVGIERVPITNVENACASGSTALRHGILAIRAGTARTVLAVGFEKMFVNDRDRSLSALESAADLDVVGGTGLQFTAVYAMRLRKRIDAGDLSIDDLVQVSVKSHANGALNPNAQHRKPVTAEQVASARRIADPLTLLMCSSICDGAAAVVLTAADADPTPAGRTRVRVRASQAGSGFTADPDGEPTLSERVVASAYDEAGLGPEDIDVAEVHDAMAPGELLQYEHLGFCGPGEMGRMLADGVTSLRGRLPVNPSGGLSSRGHPVGATGLAQAAELVWQLRGEANQRQASQPRIALAHNSGGWLEGESAACNIHIFEREEPWR